VQSIPAISPPASIRFDVDEVVPATEPIWSEPLARRLHCRLCREVHVLPDSGRLVFDAALDPLSVGMTSHPLIEAIQMAFSSHYPLTLSPDSIWLVIAQGFSHHIAENYETLRRRMVRHPGRRTLTETITSLDLANFEHAIAGFSGQIREASDPVLHATLLCDFSTTTAAIRTASEVVLMDTYSDYFDYDLMCICGIPRITVTGSVEDWRRMRERVEVLATYSLDWWVERLRPILDEFIQTAQGHPDPTFWKAIYKPKEAYGPSRVTGWIADLFPYLDNAPNRRRNHVFNFPRVRWAIPVNKEPPLDPSPFDPEADNGVSTSSFPSGLSSVPIQVSFPNGSKRELDLVAGFLAVEQDPGDLSLTPVISWAVTDRVPERPVLLIERGDGYRLDPGGADGCC